jgi:hypothetical protein
VKETNMRGGVKSGREREVSRVRDADWRTWELELSPLAPSATSIAFQISLSLSDSVRDPMFVIFPTCFFRITKIEFYILFKILDSHLCKMLKIMGCSTTTKRISDSHPNHGPPNCPWKFSQKSNSNPNYHLPIPKTPQLVVKMLAIEGLIPC